MDCFGDKFKEFDWNDIGFARFESGRAPVDRLLLKLLKSGYFLLE
jgi:hypothetical protein